MENPHAGAKASVFAHEMRNLINTAVVAFDVLKTGNVGVGGSTGAILHRTLMAVAWSDERGDVLKNSQLRGGKGFEKVVTPGSIGFENRHSGGHPAAARTSNRTCERASVRACS
jgi:hypothetical protein